jgi:cytochrome c peroxidase
MFFAIFIAALGVLMLVSVAAAQDPGLTPMEELGKALFFDTKLSLNENQSCASCHDPAWGWTGPDSVTNAHGAVYEGSIPEAFGNRKPPSAAYATLSPIFYFDEKSGLFIGGNFWDGRATGEILGNPAADQAQGPFLNPAEQALGSSADVIAKVCGGSYAELFMEVWGTEACDPDPAYVAAAYDYVGLSIAAYEGSSEVNAFSSKYDLSFGGGAKLTKEERRGRALFQGKGKCKLCHLSGKDALFTDFTFDNLGVPINPENPAYIADGFIDPGLGGFLMSMGYEEEVYEAEWGKQKVPTLRNVGLKPSEDEIKSYGHNGYFKTLEGIVHFYNTRDVLPECPGLYTEEEALAAECWPAPEVAENVNTDELGDLGLTAEEEAYLVAFLRTLSDGYIP